MIAGKRDGDKVMPALERDFVEHYESEIEQEQLRQLARQERDEYVQFKRFTRTVRLQPTQTTRRSPKIGDVSQLGAEQPF